MYESLSGITFVDVLAARMSISDSWNGQHHETSRCICITTKVLERFNEPNAPWERHAPPRQPLFDNSLQPSQKTGVRLPLPKALEG